LAIFIFSVCDCIQTHSLLLRAKQNLSTLPDLTDLLVGPNSNVVSADINQTWIITNQVISWDFT